MMKVSKDDKNAYTILYNKYFPAVTHFVSAIGGQLQTPEDISQEVFTRIWENRERYHPDASFKSFLFGCAKNVLKENTASAVKEIPFNTDELSDLIANDSKFQAVSERKDIIAYLEKAVAGLPAKQKQIFALVYITGFSSAKVARIMNCSLDAVHSALYRARKTLRNLFGSFPFDIE